MPFSQDRSTQQCSKTSGFVNNFHVHPPLPRHASELHVCLRVSEERCVQSHLQILFFILFFSSSGFENRKQNENSVRHIRDAQLPAWHFRNTWATMLADCACSDVQRYFEIYLHPPSKKWWKCIAKMVTCSGRNYSKWGSDFTFTIKV